MTYFLIAVAIDLIVVVCLAPFAIWEHRRHHAREDALAKAVEAARKRATQGDDIDEQYRTAVIAVWGSQPRPVGIHHPGGLK